MSNIELKLLITADGKVVAVETEKVKRGLKEVGEEAEKAGKRARAAFDDTGMQGYLRNIDQLGSTLKGVAGVAATIYVAEKIRAIGAAAIEAQVQLDKMGSSLRFAMGGDQARGAREMEYVRETSQKLGLVLTDTAAAYAKLAASARGTRLEGQQTREIFEAIAGAGTVMGLSAQEQSGALLAISQMMSKGTVASEELRGQLGERLPGAFNIAARAMGVTTAQLSKMLEQGQVLSDEFLPKLAAQLKKEMGDEVAKAAGNTGAEINRLATSWQNLQQQFAQSGASKFITEQLAILRDAMDDVANSMERARKEGDGFWGQMLAGFNAYQRFMNPVNAFSYTPQAKFHAEAWELQSLGQQRVDALRLSDGASTPYIRGLERRIADLQRILGEQSEKDAFAASSLAKYQGKWIGDSRGPQMPFDAERDKREEAERKIQEALLKLRAEYGEKDARYQKEHAELVLALKGASDAQILEAERLLKDKIYGADAKQKAEAFYRESVAAAEGFQRFLASAQQAQSEGLKASLEQDLISQRRYYELLAEWDRYYLEEKKKSVQDQLEAAERAAAKDPAKKADLARFKAELEQLSAEEVKITERKNVNIVKLDQALGVELLDIKRKTYQQELSAAESFVADFQKTYTERIKEHLLAGNKEMVDAYMALFREGLSRAKFTDAKREFDALMAAYKKKLEDLREQGASMGGLMGTLKPGEAAHGVREQFIPAMEAAIAKMRELADQNPLLLKAVDDAGRELTRATREMSEEQVRAWGDLAQRGGAFFVDLATNGREAFKNLRQSLKSFAQELLAIFAQRWILQIGAGLTGSSALSAAAGQVGQGTLTGSIASSVGQWALGTSLGTAGSYFASGLTGSMVGSAAGMGPTVLGSTTGIGAMSQGAGAAGSSLAPYLGAALWAAVAIAGMIVAGGQFDRGWKIDNNRNAGGNNPAARLATFASSSEDSFYRMLGFNDKWAAMLSGSSVVSRIFGHRARQNDAFGISGQIGPGGVSGRNWQDWSEQGGWLSDTNRGQETSPLTPEQLAFLNQGGQGVTSIVNRLGSNLGVDARAAVAGYKRDFNLQLNENGEPLDDAALSKLFGDLFTGILQDQVEMVLRSAGNESLATFVANLEGSADEIAATIQRILGFTDLIGKAGGRLNWFNGLIEGFVQESEAVQQAAGQILGYLATDIDELFEEVANTPRTVYESWFQLGDAIRGWTDLSAEGIVQLGNLTQQRYQAEIALVQQIQSAIEQTDQMFGDTIRSITLQTLDTPEKYDFIKTETDDLMQKIGVTTDPELLLQMSQRLNTNVADLFNMLDPATQRERLGEYTDYLEEARTAVQERLAAARKQIEAERNAALAESVATALEKALKDFAAKQAAAAADLRAGADTINNAANTFEQASANLGGTPGTPGGNGERASEVNGSGG